MALVRLHIAATAVAFLTIATFFVASIAAEVQGDKVAIGTVKTLIVYALPLLLVAMPTLALTGNRLAGTSQHPSIVRKRRRMKLIVANGMMLILLAVFLSYRANHVRIDSIFLYAQIAELFLGAMNIILIALNAKAGIKLSKRMANPAVAT